MKFFAKQLNFFYGYIIVVVLWFVYFFNVSIPLYGGGVLNSMMVSATGMDPAIIGYATSLCTIMQGVAGPFVGMLIQKKGIRLPFILGSVFLVTVSFNNFSTKNEISYVVFYGILTAWVWLWRNSYSLKVLLMTGLPKKGICNGIALVCRWSGRFHCSDSTQLSDKQWLLDEWLDIDCLPVHLICNSVSFLHY